MSRLNKLRDYLTKELTKYLKIDPEDKTFIHKQKNENLIWADQLDETHKDKFFTGNIDDIKKIKIGLEFVETQEQKDLFKYFHTKIASYKYSESVGRKIKILVKDSITNKYLGLLTFGSELLSIADINSHLQEKLKEDYHNNINKIMNIRCCISIPPFSYNFNGGKLLATIAFCKEIHDYYTKKYNSELIGFSTMGLYGKSIQYDRNKYLKLIGKTKGFTVSHIDTKLVSEGRKYLKKLGFNAEKYRGLHVINELIKQLDLNTSITRTHQQKGIYFGFYNEKKETSQEIFDNWVKRWAEQRYNHLLTEKRLMKKPTLYYYKSDEQLRKIKSFKKMVETIGEEAYREKRKIEYLRSKEKKQSMSAPITDYTVTNEELEQLKNSNITDKYIAGFFDGDGTIAIYHSGGKESGSYSIYAKINQSDLRILYAISSKYNGNIYQDIYERKTKIKENYRKNYNLEYGSFDSKQIVEKLLQNSILKYPQFKIAIDYYQHINKIGMSSERENLFNKIKEYKVKSQMQKINDKPYDRIDIDYIAGIFDAEGCCGFRSKEGKASISENGQEVNNEIKEKEIKEIDEKTNEEIKKDREDKVEEKGEIYFEYPYLEITQTNNPEILKRIGKYLKDNYGLEKFYAGNKDLRFTPNKEIFEALIKRTIVKKNQLILIKEAQDLKNTQYRQKQSKELTEKLQNIYNQIKILKKRNYIISEEVLYEVSLNKKREDEKAEEEAEKLKPKEPYRASEETKQKLSEAKKGDKNPNKKGLSEEHKKSISRATLGTHGIFKDHGDLIDTIKKDLEKDFPAKTFTELAEVYTDRYLRKFTTCKLTKDILSKIYDGLLIDWSKATDEDYLRVEQIQNEIDEERAKSKGTMQILTDRQILILKYINSKNTTSGMNKKYSPSVLLEFANTEWKESIEKRLRIMKKEALNISVINKLVQDKTGLTDEEIDSVKDEADILIKVIDAKYVSLIKNKLHAKMSNSAKVRGDNFSKTN
jgi:hypothetical protein